MVFGGLLWDSHGHDIPRFASFRSEKECKELCERSSPSLKQETKPKCLKNKRPVMKNRPFTMLNSARTSPNLISATTVAMLALAVISAVGAEDKRAPDVGASTWLIPPGNTNKVHFHAYAVGLQ